MSIYGYVNPAHNPNRRPRPDKMYDYSSGKPVKTAYAYRGQITTPAAARSYLLAGKGIFTLESTKTDTRFTYKVKRAEDNPSMLFVSVLTGPDNSTDYLYLGFIRLPASDQSPVRLVHGKKSKIGADAPSLAAIQYLMRVVEANGAALPPALRFWHEGRCAACARKLTVPASVSTGFGPECAEKYGIVWATPVCEAA